MSKVFQYGKDKLTASIALKLAKGEIIGHLCDETISRIKASREAVDKISGKDDAVYGINTGFGSLCSTRIGKDEIELLQVNILKSHSVGVGEAVPKIIAKLMLILKLHALCKGYSGISLDTINRIKWHIDEDIIPIVPSQGSVGASGDLAPLAHLFLPLIGEGEVEFQGKQVSTQKIFEERKVAPLQLQSKEGLALINGTQFITAFAVEVLDRLHSCLSQADVIAAMMVEALLGSHSPFDERLHDLRPFAANQHVAQRISRFLDGSTIVLSHVNCGRVQDPYSLRCIPQVHGASRASWKHLKDLLEVELNSVTDNPVILDEMTSISGGNFHGQPLALALDYVCVAASEIGNISDRRTYLSLKGIDGIVPQLLMKNTGTNSAFMILQYTTAALVSENKSLCYPASVDSITTSLGQEDHVSMGSIAARKALTVIENLEKVLAIELICAAQAFDYHKPLRSGLIIEEVHQLVREQIDHAEEDRIFKADIDIAHSIIRSRQILNILEHHQPEITTEYQQFFETY